LAGPLASSVPHRLTVSSPAFGEGDLPRGTAHDLQGQVAELLTGLGERQAGWWESDELAEYLADGIVSGDLVGSPWEVERRVGLALDESGTAAEGMLYSAEHLRPASRMGFAVCCMGGPDVPLADMVPLGGRGGCAQVHDAVTPPDLPEPVSDMPDGRMLLYLATPAVFADGWKPDLSAWPHAELIAAALGDPQVIAAATPNRQTGAVAGGRLMWAVPTGSVYYLKFPDEQAARAAAADLRRMTLPQATLPLATAGFGYALTGSWEPK
jgi:CRISPR-associated protein Cmr3